MGGSAPIAIDENTGARGGPELGESRLWSASIVGRDETTIEAGRTREIS
jgi:hypothetical protein